MIRADHKGLIETVEPVEISVAYNVEACIEMSRSPSLIEARAERLDEAGIT